MNEIVELCAIDPQHAERMYAWMRDPEIADHIGLRSKPSLTRTREWIEKAQAEDSIRAWAILHGDQHVGNVVLDCLDRHLQSARLSIYIGEASARGQGIAAAGLRLALALGFAHENLERIWLTVHERNTRAALLYARTGFRLEGMLRGEFLLRGERINAILMSILRGEFRADVP